jgi:aminobenzoyl-glutamate utilization protein A
LTLGAERSRRSTVIAECLTAAESLEHELVGWRRDFHRHPEPGFGEFRTAAVLVERLGALGFEVKVADAAMDIASIYHRHEERVEAAAERAEQAGVDTDLLARMKAGGTAVVADLRRDDGPTVAFRFDMDCLPVLESSDPAHRPAREGFRSLVEGEMHACGHDGHMAIGLGVASVLAAKQSELAGTVRLIFQPAEEGALGGARAICARGFMSDVDYLICSHLGLGAGSREFVARASFLATSKYQVHFSGQAAHVVNSPQLGRNALLAGASAALALHALAPHSGGWHSLNVGVMRAGDEQGVTPPWALLELGLWADAREVHDYVVERLHEIVDGTGRAWGVETSIRQIGGAPAAGEDAELAGIACRIAELVPSIETVRDVVTCHAGEDATFFLNGVAERGGKGIYTLIGSDLAAGHHAPSFDFDERSLSVGTAILGALALDLLQAGGGEGPPITPPSS